MVVGAAGGVGASTLAALLARARARRGGTVLVDLDPARCGVEVLLGIEAAHGARWADLQQVRGTVAPADLEGVLPRWCGVEVLSADRRGGPGEPAAVRAVWDSLAAARGTVVADVPARELLADAARGGPLLGPVLTNRTDLLLVIGQDVLGVAGALPVRDALGDGRTQLVLRRRARARVAPFEAAHVLDLPLLAVLPTDRRLAEAVDRGFGPRTPGWSRLARTVAHVARGAGRG